MKIIIRNAAKTDMHQVHNLIVELAIFEKEPNEVEIDDKDLEKMGFERHSFTWSRVARKIQSSNWWKGNFGVFNRLL